MKEEEREKKARSVYLANMAHEIRTPINTIIGLNNMILKETSEPSVRFYARSAKSASDMLLSIVNEVFDMTILESDTMELAPEEYSFRQLMTDIVGMMHTRTEFERLEFKYEISERIPDRLYGDRSRLKQVIVNLILNAARYTETGSVKLSVYGKSHEGQEHLLISVKDTGVGITEEELDHLSGIFSGETKSTGLLAERSSMGIELTAKILRLMDSGLHVISQYGEGSEFYFEIEQRILEDTPIGSIDISAEPEEEEEPTEQMPQIHGVDVTYGLVHAGGRKQYLTALGQFVENADSDLEELRTCLAAVTQDASDRDALKSFRNKLRAMKSQMGTLGAFQTSGIAELLEEAAGQGKTEDIRILTPYFETNWKKLKNAAKERLPIQKKNRRPEGEALDSLLHLLETCMRSNDVTNAEFVLEKLQSFTWEEEENRILKDLKNAVGRLDTAKVADLSARLKNPQ